MNIRRWFHVIFNTALPLFLISLSISCSQAQAPTSTATAQPAQTTAPTKTPVPTGTALPTSTPMPTPTRTSTPSPTSTSTPTPKNTGIPAGEYGGVIVYYSDPGEDEEVRILSLRAVAADGSFDTGLTFYFSAGDKQPSWSPDGKKVAFVRYLQDNEEIFFMDIAGGLRRLTDDPGVDMHPEWSPDGKRIAFVSNRDGDFDIYIMDVDGNEIVNLTNNNDTEDAHPDWSPDGDKIAYTGFFGNNPDIYVMNTDGSDSNRLTDTPGYDFTPTWSPNGQLIAFSSERDGNLEIYTMNADGSEQTRLTNNQYEDVYPAWSPDGSQIAFAYNPEWEPDIYIMNEDGSGLTRLTDSPVVENEPSWAPQVAGFGEQPWFGPPFCARDTDDDAFAETPTETFTEEDFMAFVHFWYDNMQDGMEWSYVWLKNGKEMHRANKKWDGGKEGLHTSFYTMPTLGTGMWTMKMYIGDQLVQEVSCEVIEP